MNNKIIIFTGPSGVGKATIEKELFKDKTLKLVLSISATTRDPRPWEVNGKHYYFISDSKFNGKIKNEEFVEYSEHFSHKYGTLKIEIKKILANGNNPFLEVETVGAKNIIKKFGKDNLLSIFLAPPSIEKLRKRIISRGSETKKQIKERLARVKMEMNDKDLFDYVVYNDVIEHTVDQVNHIIKKEINDARNY